MFNKQEKSIDDYKKVRWAVDTGMTVLYLIVSYVLITTSDIGLYVVLGYVFFRLQRIASLQFINAKETNLQLNRTMNQER